MLEPHHDFDPHTEEGALVAAIRANPHDDTPKLVMADWQDDHGSPVVAAMYRHAVEAARSDPETVAPPPPIDRATREDGIAVSRHARLLSAAGHNQHLKKQTDTAVRAASEAATTGPIDLRTPMYNHRYNRHGFAADTHIGLVDYHNPDYGTSPNPVAANAHRFAAAVHRHLAEQL